MPGEPSFGRSSSASSAPWKLRTEGSSAGAGIRAEEGDLAGAALRAVTVVGVRHRLAGLGNDDAFAWQAGASALLVAVADGLGSVPGSAQAAARAVVAAVGAGTEAVGALHAANIAVTGGEGATTLVVAAVAADGAVTVARVGDSTAFALVDRRWRELFASEVGPGDDGAVLTTTAALPASEPQVETAAVHLEAGHALVLATDGVANPLRDGPETVAPALADALARPPDALTLAGLANFSRHGCHDDRTILAVWRGR